MSVVPVVSKQESSALSDLEQGRFCSLGLGSPICIVGILVLTSLISRVKCIQPVLTTPRTGE